MWQLRHRAFVSTIAQCGSDVGQYYPQGIHSSLVSESLHIALCSYACGIVSVAPLSCALRPVLADIRSTFGRTLLNHVDGNVQCNMLVVI